MVADFIGFIIIIIFMIIIYLFIYFIYLFIYPFSLQSWFSPGLSSTSTAARTVSWSLRHLVRGYNWGGGPVPRPGGLTLGLLGGRGEREG